MQLDFCRCFAQLHFDHRRLPRLHSLFLSRKSPFAGSQFFYFRQNLHHQVARGIQCQLARQRHASRPACGAKLHFRTRLWYPAPQNSPRFVIQLALRRVERAMVLQSALLRMKHQFFRIQFAGLPIHFALRRVQQHKFVAQRKKVRALPHFT